MFLRHVTDLLKIIRSTLPHALSRSYSRVGVPRIFPKTGFKNILPPERVEDSEECLAWYSPQSFYPVRIGDVIHSNYQILYKAGFGTTSTVWICRDLRSDEYVCMKAMVCDYPSVEREIKAYEVVSEAVKTTKLAGQHFVRKALDHFELKIEDRNYHFLIHEPLGMNLELFLDALVLLPIRCIRILARNVLNALEFIHSAGIVHGDVQPKNILFRLNDKFILKDIEEHEINHPSPRKITSQAAVFETAAYLTSLKRWLGDTVVLCDFGEARTGEEYYTELIQPAAFRAPEVFLSIPWGTPVDIWSFGCMMWHLMFKNHLFLWRSSGEQADNQTIYNNQLARMFALLGPPPQELIDKAGSYALEYFNEDGLPKGEIPNETLESFLASSSKKVDRSMTIQESEMFITFIRRTITWTQEARASASDLLRDPWLTYDQ